MRRERERTGDANTCATSRDARRIATNCLQGRSPGLRAEHRLRRCSRSAPSHAHAQWPMPSLSRLPLRGQRRTGRASRAVTGFPFQSSGACRRITLKRAHCSAAPDRSAHPASATPSAATRPHRTGRLGDAGCRCQRSPPHRQPASPLGRPAPGPGHGVGRTTCGATPQNAFWLAGGRFMHPAGTGGYRQRWIASFSFRKGRTMAADRRTRWPKP